MLIKFISYCLLSVFAFFLPLCGVAQTGAPVLNVTFGEGQSNPGNPLPAINTQFNFSPEACPPPGNYTITNSLILCPATRMGRTIDNTPLSIYGYMMSVIDTTSLADKLIYVDTLTENLCPGTSYEFSAAFLNTEIPANCIGSNVHFPNFTLTVETINGTLLQGFNSGPVYYDYDLVFVPKFHVYKVDFILPAGVGALVLKIKDRAAFYSPCVYSYAIDDIKFSAAGPDANIEFNDGNGTALIKSVCFQDNKSIAFSGNVGPGFTNTAVQWQQSINNGITWTDIPGATGYNYSRSFSVPDTFLFRLRASEASKIANENCSVISNALKVEVNGIPSDIKVSNNSPVCSGSDLQFNAEGGASYVWSGPNGFSDNIQAPHIFHSSFADSGTYYAQIVTFGGCKTTDSTHVKIIGTDVKLGSDQSICKGKSVQLNAAGGSGYMWSPVIGLSDATIANPKASPEITTTYTVKVTDDFGCSNSGSVTIKLLNSIAVKAIISGPDFICRPTDTANFSNSSLGRITYANWDFGNGQSSTLFNPPVQDYIADLNRTDYSVRLIVTDSANCKDTAYHVMKVEINCYIAVPSAFTPNGDRLNDYLYPLHAYKATDLIFRVYNRLGQLVFETKDWTKKWDGTVKGEPQPSGVYVWMLSYTDANKKYVSLKGSTILIR